MSSVCRICLSGNSTLQSVQNNQLISVYEKLTNAKFNSDDARPRTLCSFCFQKLLRCDTFAQMAVRSEKIFSYLYERDLEVTHDNITEVDLKIKHQLPVLDAQVDTIDGNDSYEGYQVTIKDEPLPSIDIKEETITEPERVLEIEYSPEDSTKGRLTSEEDYGDQEKDAEEFLYQFHIKQTDPDASETTFSCNSCLKIFNIKSQLVSHIRNLHSRVESKQYSSTKKDTETSCMIADKSIQKNKFNCLECNRPFDKKHNLIRHMRTHTGETPFPCNLCGKQFKQKSSLLSHLRTHTGEKPYACHFCDKKYIQKDSLILHIRNHTGERPFACTVCDKKFKVKCNLGLHMRTHADDKPFSCHVCGNQFKRKGHLDDHLRTHTGEQSFACHVCDKRFVLKSNLTRHKRIHTPRKYPKPTRPRGGKRQLPSNGS